MRLVFLLAVFLSLRLPVFSEDPLFTRVDQESGLTFTNEASESRVQFVNSRHLFLGAGVAVGDVDGNGLPDIFLVSNSGPNRLFLQASPWKFVDATESAGGLSGGKSWGFGASFADIEGDGDLDLYVSNFGSPNELYVNQGDGTFIEEAKQRGVDVDGACVLASFSDYDQDGNLDFFLLSYRLFDLELLRPEFEMPLDGNGTPIIPHELRFEYEMMHGIAVRRGRQDFLFQNDGKGNFKDVTKESGILKDAFTHGLSATWCDFDDDGDSDLHVSNDFWGADKLWRNKGDGTFENVLSEMMPGTSWFSMGADWGDLNNDGRFDLVVADMASTTHFREKLGMGAMTNSNWFLKAERPQQSMRNMVFLQSGTGRFLEGAYMNGLAATDWTWSSLVGDLDNDGALDVFFTNGIGRDMQDSDLLSDISRNYYGGNREEADRLFRKLPPVLQENHAFRNLGEDGFSDVSEKWGLDLEGISHGAAFADLDRDGDLDIIVNNYNEPAALYRNNSKTETGLSVQLVGKQNNRNGLGAKLTLKTSGGNQTRRITQARGYASSVEPTAHFAIPEGNTIDSLTIRWPNGSAQIFTDLQPGKHHIISEAPEPSLPPVPPLTSLFEETDLSEWTHQETPFDDFESQPLLPWQHSQLGPGMAWADVDGDGDDDFFVGGAAGQSGQVFFAEGNGTFRSVSAFPADHSAHGDTMAAVFLDLDRDDDPDLVVSYGGSESTPLTRFYLNNGKGVFSLDESRPDFSGSGGSAISACDFDRDGDLDLFLGGRIVPGNFPNAPESLLLRNENGKFQIASKLQLGMVTGAIWSDVDNDGWLDLMVSTAWGSIKLLKNGNGTLRDTTKESGLSKFSGWWQGIAGADIDNDGDIDFVAGNIGRNTKYKNSLLLLHHDFDQNGRTDLVEAKTENGILKPVRGLSCSSSAIPMIREKMTSFRKFAGANLIEIYPSEQVEAASRIEINWLDSSVFLNDGEGRFEVNPLPRLAQISPGLGIVCEDFDGDGNPDIALAQNFSQTQPETSRWNGGLGVFMKGNGSGGFTSIWPDESGFVIPGNGRGLTSADLNEDGWLDLVCAANDSRPRAFLNRGNSANRMIYVKMNPEDAGSRLTLHLKNGRKIVREMYRGSGYLSQTPSKIAFGLPAGNEAEKLTIRLPNGSVKDQKLDPGIPHGTVISWQN